MVWCYCILWWWCSVCDYMLLWLLCDYTLDLRTSHGPKNVLPHCSPNWCNLLLPSCWWEKPRSFPGHFTRLRQSDGQLLQLRLMPRLGLLVKLSSQVSTLISWLLVLENCYNRLCAQPKTQNLTLPGGNQKYVTRVARRAYYCCRLQPPIPRCPRTEIRGTITKSWLLEFPVFMIGLKNFTCPWLSFCLFSPCTIPHSVVSAPAFPLNFTHCLNGLFSILCFWLTVCVVFTQLLCYEIFMYLSIFFNQHNALNNRSMHCLVEEPGNLDSLVEA